MHNHEINDLNGQMIAKEKPRSIIRTSNFNAIINNEYFSKECLKNNCILVLKPVKH